MSKDHDRVPEAPGPASGAGGRGGRGGENTMPPDRPTHEGAPHDERAKEPLGPLTPDDERPAGDTPEAHDEIIPQDLPKDHPGRQEAERLAAKGDGTTRGNT
jgi:hypothetical protein